MKIVYHFRVYDEIDQIMEYYEMVAGSELADEFYNEFIFTLRKVSKNADVLSVRFRDVRRVNLDRFRIISSSERKVIPSK